MNSDDRNNMMNVNDGRFLKPRASAPDDEPPLQLEPDEQNERPAYGWSWGATTVPKPNSPSHDSEALRDEEPDNSTPSHETILDANVSAAAPSGASTSDASAATAGTAPSGMGCDAGEMSDMLRWALDSMHEPALAAADWLARDIDPEQSTATALLTNPQITLAQAKQAKSVFKTMRIVGEKSADRRVGARMYAASIAAALVRHQQLITQQSDEALKRAFQGLLDDRRMPAPLRDLAGMALCALAEGKYRSNGRRSSQASRERQMPSSSASSMMSLPSPSDALPMPRGMVRPQPRRKRA